MANERVSMYDEVGQFQRSYPKLINSKELSLKNKKYIEAFFDYLEARGTSCHKKTAYIYGLKRFIDLSGGKDFNLITKENMIKAIGQLERLDKYSPNTKSDTRKLIKFFFKVNFGEGEYYPRVVSWIKSEIKLNELKKSSDPFTKEDIAKMISVTDRGMFRCLLSLAMESCCRPSEILTCNLLDLKPAEDGFDLKVVGKTGERTVYLIESAPYIAMWLNEHPQRNNPTAPLFVNIHGTRIKLPTANLMLKNAAKRAGITDKPLYLYWLRHSGITAKRIKGMSDGALSHFAGWVGGTKRLKVYDHSIGRDFKNELRRMYGLAIKEPDIVQKSKNCLRCHEENGYAEKYCFKCGTPLDISLENLRKEDKEKDEVLTIVNTIKEKLPKEIVMEAIKELIKEGKIKLE